jgi:hypothetical protein
MGKTRAAKKRDLDEIKGQAGPDESEDQESNKRAIDSEPKKSKQGMLAFGGP